MEHNTANPVIPDSLMKKWQRVIEILARTLEVPAGLIMKVHPQEIEVFLKSNTKGNPYEKGEKAKLNTGLYCETVMATRNLLLVPDARQDPKWDRNPDIALDMTFYLGFPLEWPDGEMFGTICVLDSKVNTKAVIYQELMSEFQEIVQSDMKLLVLNKAMEEHAQQLEAFNSVLVQRETRIIEIKKEINTLCREFRKEEIYPEIWDS